MVYPRLSGGIGIGIVTGCPILLATPQKTEYQAWGEEKNRVQELPPCLGLCFLGGGKKDETPCSWFVCVVLVIVMNVGIYYLFNFLNGVAID